METQKKSAHFFWIQEKKVYPTFYVCVFLADIPYWVVQSTIPEDDEKLICCFKGEKIMKKGGDNYDESLKSVY